MPRIEIDGVAFAVSDAALAEFVKGSGRKIELAPDVAMALEPATEDELRPLVDAPLLPVLPSMAALANKLIARRREAMLARIG